MKIVNASYEIITPISDGGFQELKQIEKVARACYNSMDKYTESIDSALDLIGRVLIPRGHYAMIEHAPSLSVTFTVDRGVSHEMVRHRLCSFAQESTRYCNYNKGKYGSEITVIKPIFFKDINFDSIEKDGYPTFNNPSELSGEEKEKILNRAKDWYIGCKQAETNYIEMCNHGASAQEARSVLPHSTKVTITMTTNYREWRHILGLRCSTAAHPQIREVMVPLAKELRSKIPLIFDHLYDSDGKEVII